MVTGRECWCLQVHHPRGCVEGHVGAGLVSRAKGMNQHPEQGRRKVQADRGKSALIMLKQNKIRMTLGLKIQFEATVVNPPRPDWSRACLD